MRALQALACVHCMKMDGCDGSILSPRRVVLVQTGCVVSALHTTPTCVAMGS